MIGMQMNQQIRKKLWVMNSIYRYIALLLFVFGVCACDKEQKAGEVYSGLTREVSVVLEASMDDDFRSIHAVNEDGTTGRLQMAERDLEVRVAIRQGTGTPLYHTLTFKKVAGLNQVTFKGKLTVPDGGTGAYSLAAIPLKEVGGHVYAALDGLLVKTVPSNMLVLPVDGKVDTKVPYLANWTELTLESDGKSFVPVSLRFKPSGTLLAIRVSNVKGKDDLTVSKIKVKSNAFVTAWEYDFENLDQGNLLQGRATSTQTDLEFDLPQAVTIEAGQLSTVFHYLTAMPVKADTGLSTIFTIVTSSGQEIAIPNNTRKLLAGTVPATLRVPGEKVPDDISNSCFKSKRLPIEFLAHYNVTQSGTDFDKTMGNQASGYFNYEDAKAKFAGGVTIEGKSYRLPSLAEMQCIIPIKTMHLKSGREYLDVQETIAADREEYSTTADYRVETTDGVVLPRRLYALRLKNKNLCMQTAYRYEFVGEFVNGSQTSHLKVTCRYLGNSHPWTIDDVASEEFWARNTSEDIIRYLPATNGNTSGSSRAGVNGLYWTTTPYRLQGYAMGAAFQYYENAYRGEKHFEINGEQNSVNKLMSVRLLADEPVVPANQPKP